MRDFTIVVVLAFLLCVSGTLRAQSVPEIPSRPSIAANAVVQVYPNPATDYVYLRFESMNAADVNISIRNIIGNEVPFDKEEVDQHSVRLRVKDFASGYYLAVLQDDHTKFRGTYKFVKR